MLQYRQEGTKVIPNLRNNENKQGRKKLHIDRRIVKNKQEMRQMKKGKEQDEQRHRNQESTAHLAN